MVHYVNRQIRLEQQRQQLNLLNKVAFVWVIVMVFVTVSHVWLTYEKGLQVWTRFFG